MGEGTKIQKFFESKSVFLTGGTGLIGSLLIEKFLRCCPNVGKMYILVRTKWNVSYEKRFEDMFNSPIFDRIKETDPNQLKKVVMVKGNLKDDNLGLKLEDWNVIKEEVHCIFHVGASVKFTDPLSSALMTNVKATHEITKLAKETKNLQSFIYVSTGFSQCLNSVVKESFYKSLITSEALLLLANAIEPKKLDAISSIFTGEFPNTYTFTKHLSEDFLERNAQDLPLAIVRPTIISPTYMEPIPGWGNALHSLSQYIGNYNIGLNHVMYGKPNQIWDLIPADFVVNQIVAASWEVGSSWNQVDKHIRIYNCASSDRNPITKGRFQEYGIKYDTIYPSNKRLWHRYVLFTTSDTIYMITYLLQLFQMYFLDFASYLMGQPQLYKKIYHKVYMLTTLTKHFVETTWLFKTDNTKMLWDKLEEDDKALFNFDVTSIDWDLSISNCVKGVRLYVLKENPETLPAARSRAGVLKILHYVILLIFVFIIIRLLKGCLLW